MFRYFDLDDYVFTLVALKSIEKRFVLLTDICFVPFAQNTFTEPTGNVAPRIAGDRYQGKLETVLLTKIVALDCEIQGSPVPFTRYVALFV